MRTFVVISVSLACLEIVGGLYALGNPDAKASSSSRGFCVALYAAMATWGALLLAGTID